MLKDLPKKNAYVCPKLHTTVTEDLVKGTTPMFITCPICQANGELSTAGSMMYRIDQSLTATHEWYKPTAEDWKDLQADISSSAALMAMHDHVDKGGLLIRRKAGQ